MYDPEMNRGTTGREAMRGTLGGNEAHDKITNFKMSIRIKKTYVKMYHWSFLLKIWIIIIRLFCIAPFTEVQNVKLRQIKTTET